MPQDGERALAQRGLLGVGADPVFAAGAGYPLAGLAPRTPGIWNPLPYFNTVKADHQEGNIADLSAFYRAAQAGTLPAVSWIAPSGKVSEHPP